MVSLRTLRLSQNRKEWHTCDLESGSSSMWWTRGYTKLMPYILQVTAQANFLPPSQPWEANGIQGVGSGGQGYGQHSYCDQCALIDLCQPAWAQQPGLPVNRVSSCITKHTTLCHWLLCCLWLVPCAVGSRAGTSCICVFGRMLRRGVWTPRTPSLVNAYILIRLAKGVLPASFPQEPLRMNRVKFLTYL